MEGVYPCTALSPPVPGWLHALPLAGLAPLRSFLATALAPTSVPRHLPLHLFLVLLLPGLCLHLLHLDCVGLAAAHV